MIVSVSRIQSKSYHISICRECKLIKTLSIADNPILYASDGFVSVTGYSRHDIIPRNCRFLQGERTDPMASKRLKFAIENCEETVELLLNYRKNGEPFWNLLYVAPLLNERGEVSFFLGGQINCNTTIHSYNDVLRVLSINDEESLDFQTEEMGKAVPASLRSGRVKKSSFFKSWKKPSAAGGPPNVVIKEEMGMEGELLGRIGRLNFKTQVETFYTAYSKVSNPCSPPRPFLQINRMLTGTVHCNALHVSHLPSPNRALLPWRNRHALPEPPQRTNCAHLPARYLQSDIRILIRFIIHREIATRHREGSAEEG